MPQITTPPISGDTDHPPQPYLNIHDLMTIAADINNSLPAVIAELRLDIHTLNDRVQEVERVMAQRDHVLRKATRKIDTHTLQLREVQRHVEDLDNRGHCHNLRIRGLSEAIDSDHLSPAVTGMFNGLLGRPPQTQADNGYTGPYVPKAERRIPLGMSFAASWTIN